MGLLYVWQLMSAAYLCGCDTLLQAGKEDLDANL